MKCNMCEHSIKEGEELKVSKSGGGSYKRANSHRNATICPTCAEYLEARVTPGHYSVNLYDVSSLEHALEGYRKKFPNKTFNASKVLIDLEYLTRKEATRDELHEAAEKFRDLHEHLSHAGRLPYKWRF